MKHAPNPIRRHAATALLLAPLALAMLAGPAQAQQRAIVAQPPAVTVTVAPAIAPAPAPVIERFTARSHGRIRPGSELQFRLAGVPGARASVDIPGVTRNLELRETRPGFYEANYTVGRRDDPKAFSRAEATLQMGPHRVTARVDLRGDDVADGRRDERPPVITELSPAQGERVENGRRTHISARLKDEGSGVDPASVRLTLNGRDVTGETRVDADELHFRGFLAKGRHTAELVVKDRAGNTTRQSWTFQVRGRG
jgi:hypothetical protein